LVLFNYVERHGEPLFDLLKSCDKNVFFVHGGIKPEEREAIRRALEVSNDNILLASLGTTSTGVNIVNLDNVIFAHPSKSKIRNLQSIGRVLRKKDDESLATLYDIVDDLRGGRSQENYALKHFQARVQQYANEHFDFKMYPISLG
jgi:superfamily II DNA or RNA helicase